MWLSDRRKFLLSALALGGCGFQPVYGTGGGGGQLLNAVALPDPVTEQQYQFVKRFEERMGRASAQPAYRLEYSISSWELGQGATSTGSTTRYRVNGTVSFTFKDANGVVVASGSEQAFTSYSTTGSTAATRASQQDAEQRLSVILADQMVDRLLSLVAG
ncbi:MAG: LPS assembly lipoprotein LptE [Pelagimonas sp.]|jgi:LPS-assembly lipoprotein|nr:LPS assembly lipoprotein LptE [Pelagimonas sp.]